LECWICWCEFVKSRGVVIVSYVVTRHNPPRGRGGSALYEIRLTLEFQR